MTNRLPNLFNSPNNFKAFKGTALFIGVFNLRLISGITYLVVFIDMKTGKILEHRAFNIKINGSLISALLHLLINLGVFNPSNTVIHTPFDSKKFLSILKINNLKGSNFTRSEFIPFYVKLFILLAGSKPLKYESPAKFIEDYTNYIQNVNVSDDGRNLTELPGFPVQDSNSSEDIDSSEPPESPEKPS